MRIHTLLQRVAVALGLVAIGWSAQAGDAGTVYLQPFNLNGITIGYAQSISDNWALRGQYSFFNPTTRNESGTDSDGVNYNYSAKIDWNSYGVFADWYPGSGGFRLTPGIVVTNNKFTLTGTMNANGQAATGTMGLQLSDAPAPYFGIGYGQRPGLSHGLGFSLDLGLMYVHPKVSASLTGTSQSNIDAETNKAQSDLDKLKFFPVIGLGMSYSF